MSKTFTPGSRLIKFSLAGTACTLSVAQFALTGGLLVLSAPFPRAWATDLTLFLAASPESTPVPDLAREVRSLNSVCAKCHNLEIVMDTPMSFDDWHETVQKMVDRGASGTDEQFDDIMDYLHRTMTTIDVNTAGVNELEIVLQVPETVARAIIAQRSKRKFTGLADLKSVPGIDASNVDSKARLILFK